jgi:cytoskeletal protein RodZ
MTAPTPEGNSGKEAGESDLKSIRNAKGIPLREIFAATRITTVNLAAIEDGHYHLLPEPVYARTFIKTYAAYLNVDSRPILESYERYLGSLNITPPTTEDHQKTSAQEKKTGVRRRLMLLSISIIVVSIAIFYLMFPEDSNILNLSKPQPPPPVSTAVIEQQLPLSPQSAPLHPQGTPEAAKEGAAPTPATGQTVNTPISGQPVQRTAGSPGQAAVEQKRYRLTITGTDTTWFRIREDHKQSQEMVIQRGDIVERSAEEAFIVDIGNAGGVEVSFQGKSLGNLGKKGQVVHLKLP